MYTDVVSLYVVSFQLDKINTVWVARKESCRTDDLRSQDRTSYLMDNLHADTYYKVEVRAHNEIGFSVPSELVFKTAMGKYTLKGSKIKLYLRLQEKKNKRLASYWRVNSIEIFLVWQYFCCYWFISPVNSVSSLCPLHRTLNTNNRITILCFDTIIKYAFYRRRNVWEFLKQFVIMAQNVSVYFTSIRTVLVRFYRTYHLFLQKEIVLSFNLCPCYLFTGRHWLPLKKVTGKNCLVSYAHKRNKYPS